MKQELKKRNRLSTAKSVCVCVCVLTVDLVVWREQPDVGEGDAACVAVIKLHCDQIIVVINI